MGNVRTPTPIHQPLHSHQVDSLLDKAGSLLTHSLNLSDTLERLGDLLVPQFADWCGVALRDAEGDEWRLSHTRRGQSAAANLTAQIESVFGSWSDERSWTRRVLDHGHPVLVEEVTEAWLRREFPDSPEALIARSLGVRSCLYLPLQLDGKRLGAILLLVLDSGRKSYSAADLAVARRLALIAAAALRNAGLWDALRRELAERHRVEETLRESLEREALDIVRLKNTEAELRRHREELEQIVAERTRELEATYGRLLEAERMATIGTLSAGLGHDMGNLLLPLRLRLDSLRTMDLPDVAGQDLEAIGEVVAYLQRLTSGLRLLAGDPKAESNVPEPTRLRGWWKDVESLLRDSLPPGVIMECELPAGLPPVRMPASALTQVVFNVVQNAGQALQERAGGRVRIEGQFDAKKRVVHLLVTDNGPGMDPEVMKRCFEPYFSTKKRLIATGLGLPLVRALLHNVGGTISVHSTLGEGSTFSLTVPTAETRVRRSRTPRASRVARVTVQDRRIRSLITSVLRTEGFYVGDTDQLMQGQGQVWISDDASPRTTDALLEFVVSGPERIAIVLNRTVSPVEHARIHALESGSQVTRLREILDGIGPSDVRGQSSEVRAPSKSVGGPRGTLSDL